MVFTKWSFYSVQSVFLFIVVIGVLLNVLLVHLYVAVNCCIVGNCVSGASLHLLVAVNGHLVLSRSFITTWQYFSLKIARIIAGTCSYKVISGSW